MRSTIAAQSSHRHRLLRLLARTIDLLQQAGRAWDEAIHANHQALVGRDATLPAIAYRLEIAPHAAIQRELERARRVLWSERARDARCAGRANKRLCRGSNRQTPEDFPTCFDLASTPIIDHLRISPLVSTSSFLQRHLLRCLALVAAVDRFVVCAPSSTISRPL